MEHNVFRSHVNNILTSDPGELRDLAKQINFLSTLISEKLKITCVKELVEAPETTAPRSYNRYTEDQKKTLRYMIDAGDDASTISKATGISASAIYSFKTKYLKSKKEAPSE